MEIKTVPLENPDSHNVILGQSHFIKTVEDLHEAMVNSVPGIQFGLAFCEASGEALVRKTGTSQDLITLAVDNAMAISAGHVFVLFIGNAFPVNVLNAVKGVPEVCRVFCATANPVQVLVAETEQGRGVLGVVDGEMPKGVEDDAATRARMGLLRQIGYKLA
jgi:adenosine/AMP kinase